MSLAQSILEYISKNIKCKTLFSTHYHELTSLERNFSNIKNIHVSAKEENGTITFLHKIKSGAVDKSYGIHVASLAGMPKSLLNRANEILSFYEKESKKKKQTEDDTIQLVMDFEEEKKTDELREYLNQIDPLRLTPMDALNVLYELKQKNDKEKKE